MTNPEIRVYKPFESDGSSVYITNLKNNVNNNRNNINNNNDNNDDNKNPRKRPNPNKIDLRPRKKFKDDDELIDFFIDETNKKDSKDICRNPLCDHKDFTKEEKKNYVPPTNPVELKSIDDLIELGKTFHCKKNTIYFGINLRILCNLVIPLSELKKLVGMKNVKQHIVNQIIFFLQGFNRKDKCGNCIDCAYNLPCSKNANTDMLHTVITGPPGVGKTELGKVLGKVYQGMGILSKGHMNIASRSDLIGKYLGHTAAKTQDFINKCAGGVMFIDEAYALGNPEGRDSFSKECIDTLNQNLTERRDFLCIIAGYADALDKSFFNFNEGLKRRFTFRYDIQGYSAEELMEIFFVKVRGESWSIDCEINESDNDVVKKEKIIKLLKLTEFFRENKKFFPYYGGDVETLFLNCKIHHGRRVIFKDPNLRKVITMEDVKSGFETFIKNRQYIVTEELVPLGVRMMYM